MDDKPYLRYTPKQKRSLERFNQLLDVADQLFAEHGYDNVSTNHIADAANVAIGSVYHFFPSKAAVLMALIDRYRSELAHIFPQETAPPRQIAEILQEMIVNLLAFQQTRTNFAVLLRMGEQSAQIDSEGAMQSQIIAWIEDMLGKQFPQLAPQRRHLCAVTGFGIMSGLLNLEAGALNIGNPTLQLEARWAITSYLASFLKREGIDGSAQIGTL